MDEELLALLEGMDPEEARAALARATGSITNVFNGGSFAENVAQPQDPTAAQRAYSERLFGSPEEVRARDERGRQFARTLVGTPSDLFKQPQYVLTEGGRRQVSPGGLFAQDPTEIAAGTTPGAGTVQAGRDAVRDFSEGRIGSGFLNAISVPLDLVGMGGAVRAGGDVLAAAGRGGFAADAARTTENAAATARTFQPAYMAPDLGETLNAKRAQLWERVREYSMRPDNAAPAGEFGTARMPRRGEYDEKFATRVAETYENAKSAPDDPDVQAAYGQFASEIDEQYRFMTEELGIEVVPTTDDPYKNSTEMMRDVLENGRLKVFTGGEDHPLLSRDANTRFRAVHDFLGHAIYGNSFGKVGEEGAFRAHAELFSPGARRAMATETRGQNSWVNYGPHGEHNRANPQDTRFAEQKVFVLPEEMQAPIPSQVERPVTVPATPRSTQDVVTQARQRTADSFRRSQGESEQERALRQLNEQYGADPDGFYHPSPLQLNAGAGGDAAQGTAAGLRTATGSERITAPAVRTPDGRVFADVNHATAWDAAHRELGDGLTSSEDGFLTSNGRFVDRNEAFRIASQQNQIDNPRAVAGEGRQWLDSWDVNPEGAAALRTVDEITDDIMRTAGANPDGFTMRTETGELHTPEMGGFSVAPSKETELVVDPSNRDAVREWVSNNLDAIRSGHVGGWLRSRDNAYVLDIPRVVDTAEEAMRLGRVGQQEAIFDFANMQEIPVPGIALTPEIMSAGRPRSGVFDAYLGGDIQGTRELPEFAIPAPRTDRTQSSMLVDAILARPEPVTRVLDDDVSRAIELYGDVGPQWYNLGALRRFMEDVGSEADFDQFNMLGGAASTRNQVTNEIALATVLNYAARHGIPFEEAARAFAGEAGRGIQMMPVHEVQARRVLEEGVLRPSKPFSADWKTPSYTAGRLGGGGLLHDAPGGSVALDTMERRRIMQAVMGDPQLRRVARATGADAAALTDGGMLPLQNAQDYLGISSLYTGGAGRFGLPTGQSYQAARWIGGANETGLATDPSKTFQQLLEDRVVDTVRRRGGDARSTNALQDYLGQVVRGEAFLYPPLPASQQRGLLR